MIPHGPDMVNARELSVRDNTYNTRDSLPSPRVPGVISKPWPAYSALPQCADTSHNVQVSQVMGSSRRRLQEEDEWPGQHLAGLCS